MVKLAKPAGNTGNNIYNIIKVLYQMLLPASAKSCMKLDYSKNVPRVVWIMQLLLFGHLFGPISAYTYTNRVDSLYLYRQVID